MNKIVVGQKWISQMEPELGLATVTKVEGGRVFLSFGASSVERQYSIVKAPVKRVEFKVGDKIRNSENVEITVSKVTEEGGLFIYHGNSMEIYENDLSDELRFSTPEERLLGGYTDKSSMFDLRYKSILQKYKSRKSDLRGILGGRIDLIHHQLYIANEVSHRQIPRVLLSDEVGLGKTIEAALIIHRMIITGRVKRVLILVPDTLIYQWVAEMLHRFSLKFFIFDEGNCEALSKTEYGCNPFLEAQLGICSVDMLDSNEELKEQAINAGWDMLVVDEAHHIEEYGSRYNMIKDMLTPTTGLLLLTATPLQLGLKSHFARLQLLDPVRYDSFEDFFEEEKGYKYIADIADKIISGVELSQKQKELLTEVMSGVNVDLDEFYRSRYKDERVRSKVIKELVDRHGISRVIYRNIRNTIKGFPKRKPNLVGLQLTGQIESFLIKEIKSDLKLIRPMRKYNFMSDPRVKWLAEQLVLLKDRKVLLICKSAEKVLAINEALKNHGSFKTAVFHEGLSIEQRNKNAIWFAHRDGAQILISSEIGSEGRNFQFAQHLVLFDLPDDPELLEQRIGRLDRIGQIEDINIHVLYFEDSISELLVKWHHDGMGAIEANLNCGSLIYDEYKNRLVGLVNIYESDKKQFFDVLNGLVEDTKKLKVKLSGEIAEGRDRLLEINSFDDKVASKLVKSISKYEEEYDLEEYLFAVFDQFGISVKEIEPRTYHLRMLEVINDGFPSIGEGGMSVTFDRSRALSREDFAFITSDHPLVEQSFDLILGSEYGNSSFGVWHDNSEKAAYLEVVFVVESISPINLYPDRFLPPTPIRVVVNHIFEDCTVLLPHDFLELKLREGDPVNLLSNQKIVKELLPAMLDKAELIVEDQKSKIIEDAILEMETLLKEEYSRLMWLKHLKSNVRDEELYSLEKEMSDLKKYISGTTLRVDSVRFIWRAPV